MNNSIMHYQTQAVKDMEKISFWLRYNTADWNRN